ncbi:MAG: hypothetical protein HYW09_00400 [Candidatus Niyogibacteria bacterium]|nr:hypothetical protein [Candidatus Niyogibacteria bacterium]
MPDILLNERENKILEFLVRDYIETAEPVSSVRIRTSLKLKESPATVRSIVAGLCECGYLTQPHVSAGRVPTDTAYRYFVDNLMSEITPNARLIMKLRSITRREKSAGRIFSEIFNLLSFESADGEHFGSHGLSRLLSEPEFEDGRSVRNAGYLMDNIDAFADIYRKESKKNLEIFIGEENPVQYARDFGVFYLETGEEGRPNILLLVGPKRMNYERVSSYADYFLREF